MVEYNRIDVPFNGIIQIDQKLIDLGLITVEVIAETKPQLKEDMSGVEMKITKECLPMIITIEKNEKT